MLMLSGGKQTDWEAVRKTTDLPIITIITSTFNAVNDLPWTLNSIKNQTYSHIQWIVADGASRDDTVEYLQQNSDVIDYWFSDSDTGIYDAWNKALKHVKGDWVQFLGAGDELYEANTLEQVAQYLKGAYPVHEVVYGKILYLSEKGRKDLYTEGEPWEYYKDKWMGNQPALPPHPVAFHHHSIFQKSKYETAFKIVADSHLLMQHLTKPFLFMPIIIDKMLKGGVSSTPKGMVKCYEELEQATKMLKLKQPLPSKLKGFLRYQFTKNSLKIMSEQQYGQLIDTIKMLRGKPKVFTVK